MGSGPPEQLVILFKNLFWYRNLVFGANFYSRHALFIPPYGLTLSKNKPDGKSKLKRQLIHREHRVFIPESSVAGELRTSYVVLIPENMGKLRIPPRYFFIREDVA